MNISNISYNQNFGAVKLADLNMLDKFSMQKFRKICRKQANNSINIYVQQGTGKRFQYVVGDRIIKTGWLGRETKTLEDAAHYADCLAIDTPPRILEYKFLH